MKFKHLLLAIALLIMPLNAVAAVAGTAGGFYYSAPDTLASALAITGGCQPFTYYSNADTGVTVVSASCAGSGTYTQVFPISTVGNTGAYADLTGTPTALSAFTNDLGFITTSSLSPYLLSSTAASTYFAKPTGTTMQYLDGTGAAKVFPTNLSSFINGPGYIDSTALTPYLLSTTAASTYATQTALALKYDASNPSGFVTTAGARSAISVTGNGSYNSSTGVINISGGGSRTFQYPSRSLNTCFQISTSQDADFHYAVDVTTGLSLTSGAQGTVIATSYTNSGCTSGAQALTDGTSGQSGTLIVGLGINQVVDVELNGTLPKNTWMKITTANTVGTPTFAIRAAQAETLLP